jgi:predicted nucleic acid-binding protein
MNLVDTSGWLEYFANGKNAGIFARPIEDTDNLIVSAINVYEVFKKVLTEKGETAALQAAGVLQQAKVIAVDSSLAINAARISRELKIPMADSIILTTARELSATLWTQDADFKGMPGVRYIRKR